MEKEVKTPKVKKVKDAKKESQKIIDNHKKAAMHHHEAAKHQIAGNGIMACGCNTKANDQTDLASKLEKKNKKRQAIAA
jgi:hypothetical protein